MNIKFGELANNSINYKYWPLVDVDCDTILFNARHIASKLVFLSQKLEVRRSLCHSVAYFPIHLLYSGVIETIEIERVLQPCLSV